MGHDAIKLELIEWLAKLKDPDTIKYLKVVKDSTTEDHDWWDDLNEDQKKGIVALMISLKAEQYLMML